MEESKSVSVIRKGNDAYVIFSADEHEVLRAETRQR